MFGGKDIGQVATGFVVDMLLGQLIQAVTGSRTERSAMLTLDDLNPHTLGKGGGKLVVRMFPDAGNAEMHRMLEKACRKLGGKAESPLEKAIYYYIASKVMLVKEGARQGQSFIDFQQQVQRILADDPVNGKRYRRMNLFRGEPFHVQPLIRATARLIDTLQAQGLEMGENLATPPLLTASDYYAQLVGLSYFMSPSKQKRMASVFPDWHRQLQPERNPDAARLRIDQWLAQLSRKQQDQKQFNQELLGVVMGLLTGSLPETLLMSGIKAGWHMLPKR